MQNKYTIVCEGKTEEYLFQSLKTTIFINRQISQCKKHKLKVIKGTINSNSYIKSRNCCKVFYLIDKDNIANDKILQHKNKIKKYNGKNGELIISNPCIEIILLAIFEDNINVSSLSKTNLKKRLTKALISKKIINENEEYTKANNDVLEKIIKFLEKNEKFVSIWIKNLSKLKYEEKGIQFNNFEIIIKFLKEKNNE